MKMILLLFAVLLTSASEVQRLLKGANLTEKQLSKEEIQDLSSQMNKDHGIALEKSPGVSIANYKETEKDKLCKLFEISKDVLVIVIQFAGAEGMDKFPKTCKKFEKLAPYIYQSLEQISLAVRNVRNTAIFQEDTDLLTLFRKAIKPKRLSASIPFRLMNGEFITDPKADPTLICGLQNKGAVSFCALRAPSLDALNLDVSDRSCVFSDVLKFPRYNSARGIPKIRKVMQCFVSHPNQKEPNQYYLSCASKPKLLGHVGGQAVLVCTSKLPKELRTKTKVKTELLYEYIVESNKGVFHWSQSSHKHIFMNENVIAFCNPGRELKGQLIIIFSVFDGGARSFMDNRLFEEPKLTLPVITSYEPGYASIRWSENDVTIVTPESDWKSDDDNLIESFN